ncbi:MAG: F0F1 ATP synthase subunit B [Deltaproteobacteria bacterium]|nr:F0F1 ATP synthase subunit B [Deltaproteobacteria bacterium]MBW2179010.1 F0F1 ATP synthase subunit B [Deltaproteobacteria bacterium]
MNKGNKRIRCCMFVVLCMAIFIYSGNDAYASDGSGGWRSTYDTGMMIFNFIILVILFIKFAKNPLKDFLENRRLEIAREIRRIEDEKKEWLKKIKSAKNDLDESEVRFKKIKQRMVDQGEKKKMELIDSAKKQSEAMIDKARQKIENNIVRAKNTLRSELVDAAMELAVKNLPNEINEKDKDKFIDQYLSSVTEK